MSILTSAIHSVLQGLFHLTGSYGWTIILLTLGIRVLMLPLSLWQQRSAQGTAAMQDAAQEIQKRYQGDEAQKKLQELYGRSGWSMLAGCFPLVLQWPVFMAMYGALSSFPFAVPAASFLWLQNLGAPDPYFILPLLAVATSVWQTWASVPRQQRLTMMILPVLFGFFMVKASAALALYWVAGNILSLVQFYVLGRRGTVALTA